MRNRSNTLLTGVATLALLAATGLASAQGVSKDQGGAGAPSATKSQSGGGAPSAAKSMNHNQGGQTGQHAQSEPLPRNSQNAQNAGSAASNTGKGAMAQQNQNSSQRHNRTVQRQENGSGTTAQQQPKQRGDVTADRQQRDTAKSAQRQERNQERGLKGLQGNTSVPMQGSSAGGNIQLSEQQRTTIRDSVIDARGAPRADHVNFDVRVGTVVPRRDIHVVPVPRTLVRIQPRWHGYLYFVYEDQVVIVNPRTMQIVAVLNA